jgi:hypothetical protein
MAACIVPYVVFDVIFVTGSYNTVAEAVAVDPLASVMVILYIPLLSPVILYGLLTLLAEPPVHAIS